MSQALNRTSKSALQRVAVFQLTGVKVIVKVVKPMLLISLLYSIKTLSSVLSVMKETAGCKDLVKPMHFEPFCNVTVMSTVTKLRS